MSHRPPPLPEHAPLEPCPFCGRPVAGVAYQVTPKEPVTYSVGCWRDPSPFAREPFWEDCLGPQTSWTPDLNRAVTLWNQRSSNEGGIA